MITFFVTWFYSGLSPKAKGTCGTIAALPIAFFIHMQLGMQALAIGTAIVFFAGWWASSIYMKRKNTRDDLQEIVVDEVAGMWLTLCAIPELWSALPLQQLALYYGAAFVAFRFFDILKPWPISVADGNIKGAFGVMLDDILAGIFAMITIGLAQFWLLGGGVNVVTP